MNVLRNRVWEEPPVRMASEDSRAFALQDDGA